MRKFILLGASALVLALGVAQASANGQSGPTATNPLGQPVAERQAQQAPTFSSFEAHEPADATPAAPRHYGR